MVFTCQNPRYPLQQLRDEMERLWSGFFGPTAEGPLSPVLRNQPAVNVWEQGDALLVEMELPGIKSDQLDISVTGDELSVKIHRPEVEQADITYLRRERPAGSFARTLRLPVEVNADRVEAELHDGVLSITLPKAENVKPRKINVTAS